ncbi:MAG: fused MFS/spermidine synthase [Gemmatimonadaceae bacterium]
MPRRPTVPVHSPPEVIPGRLPLLLALFVGSGACALIYEVVWFQLLELVVGSTAISVGVLLATYMGGMCIGSLALPKFVSRRRHPLRTYAMLELGIGIIGLVELFAIPLIGRMYTPVLGHGFGQMLLRGIVAAICLLPPTVLMGATLPAIARWIESSPRGMSWLGFFYGGNIVGAVIGSVSAGFWLLRVYDQSVATYAAVALNLVVAGLAYVLSLGTAYAPQEIEEEDDEAAAPGSTRIILIAIGVSGATALGAEVVWTRLLALTFGASTYTFSMILAVFLGGLGIGSSAASWLSRMIASPRRAFAWCQALLVVAIAWAAMVIYLALPNWPVNPALAPSAWFALQMDLVRCALVVLPGAVLWGASFPLALASLAGSDDSARLVSRVYASNTVGAILGALVCSVGLVPLMGTRGAQQVLIGLSAIGACVLFASLRRERPTRPVGSLGMTIVAAVLLIVTLPHLPGVLVAHGRYAVTWLGRTETLYVGEGMNSSVAVTKLLANGATQFHVSGKVEASSLPQDMKLQRMLAHLPALVHLDPKSVLVVGFGAGVTAGSFLPYPSLERLVICEIEPLIPQVVSRWFTKENNDVAHDRRTQIVFDDARSFVLTTDEKFDIITSDPINPWVKGAASLYTREYFESVKAHLNPGGVVTQWVPLYESTLEAVQSELATFFEVFPNGTIWANTVNGAGYDLVLMAQNEPSRVDMRALGRRFQDQRYQAVASSLIEVGFDSPLALFSTYAGQGRDMTLWLKDAAVNTDRNLRLQYLAGLGLNQNTEGAIYDQISKQRRFPAGLFVADTGWIEQLKGVIGR